MRHIGEFQIAMEITTASTDGCNVPTQADEPTESIPNKKAELDGGWGWVITFSSFMMNFLTDGVALTFGLFFKDFVEHFNGSIPKTQSLNSISVGISYLIGPLAGSLTNRFGCRKVTMAGCFISSMGLFFSTFSPTLDIMIILYAVVGGFGFGLMMLPAQVAITHYFQKRLSFANGISRCGSGIGAFVFAPLSVYLLDTYGWRGAIWITSGLSLNGMVFAALYRPNIIVEGKTRNINTTREERESMCSSIKNVFDISLLSRPAMWCYGIICFLVLFGYFIPYNFLPTYVDDIGLTANQAALLISIISICNTVMRVVLGLLGDQPWADSILIHSILLVVAGTTTCLMPSTNKFAVLITYSVVFGSTLAAFIGLKPSILLEVLGSHKLSNIYGVVNTFQGVALFLGSPVSGLLVDATGTYNNAFYLAGASIVLAGILGFPLRALGKRESQGKLAIPVNSK